MIKRQVRMSRWVRDSLGEKVGGKRKRKRKRKRKTYRLGMVLMRRSG